MTSTSGSSAKVMIVTVNEQRKDEKLYLTNILTIHRLEMTGNSIEKVSSKDYTYITLGIERLYVLDFEFYPKYNLLILADRMSKLHYLYYDSNADDYTLWWSYPVPDVFNELEYHNYEADQGKRLPSFPTAIQHIPSKNKEGVDKMILVTYIGDVFMVEFYGNNRYAWPQFKLISVNQNDLNDIN